MGAVGAQPEQEGSNQPVHHRGGRMDQPRGEAKRGRARWPDEDARRNWGRLITWQTSHFSGWGRWGSAWPAGWSLPDTRASFQPDGVAGREPREAGRHRVFLAA